MCCRFVYSVERLTAFHSSLIYSLRAALLNALPQVGAMLQALLLDVLQRRAAKMSDLMIDMKPLLPGLLASQNHALQNNALQLLKVLLPSEPDETAGRVERCMQSSNVCNENEFCNFADFHGKPYVSIPELYGPLSRCILYL